jgi:hypothetical protein
MSSASRSIGCLKVEAERQALAETIGADGFSWTSGSCRSGNSSLAARGSCVFQSSVGSGSNSSMPRLVRYSGKASMTCPQPPC